MKSGRETRCGGAGVVVSAAIIAVVLLGAPLNGSPQTGKKGGDVSDNAGFSDEPFLEWLEGLRRDARRAGISDRTLDAALRDIAPVMRVIELDRHQPEFTQTFWTYLGKRVNEKRVERGRAMLEKHRDLLDEIMDKYEVPPRYIIAFWGLETNFGDYTGSFRVIDSLATLAYDQRRAKFFRSELIEALKIIEGGHITPDNMKGSWAGAMGHVQFLPSTYNGYAVDHTGNGRKDIWASLPDAFASAANYLSQMGWRPGQIWGREVRLPGDFDPQLASMNIKKTIKEWSAMGVRRANGQALPKADMEGSIVLPDGSEGPAFLVYDNFRVIMRWNRSVSYAVAVGHLADRIAGASRLAAGSFYNQ